MKQTHIIKQHSVSRDEDLKYRPRTKVKTKYIYPEPNEENDTKVLKELAQYFAKKIQQSSTK